MCLSYYFQENKETRNLWLHVSLLLCFVCWKESVVFSILEFVWITDSWQIYCAVHKCIWTQVWNSWEILANCTQLDDIFLGTYACYCSGNFHYKEALYSINPNFSSPSPHTSFQWVLPETLPTQFYCLSCWGMLTCQLLHSVPVPQKEQKKWFICYLLPLDFPP